MDWLFGGGFKRSRLLPNIEAALHRLKIKITSEKAAAAKERKEVLALLKGGREELAKIRAEALFSSDNRTEALNILELYLELLRSRVDLLCEEKDCPSDLEVTVASICFAQSRIQIAELTIIKDQLRLKYGGVKFDSICSKPNERLVKCLALTPPSLPVVIRYLEEISASYGVDYTPGDGGCRAPSLPTPPPPSSAGGGSGGGDLYPFVPAPLPGQALPAPGPGTVPAPAPIFAVEVQAVPVNLGTGVVIDVAHGGSSNLIPYASAVGADAGGGGEKAEQDDFKDRLAALRR